MVTREELRAVCGKYTTGVTVATVLEGGERPHGVTVNSFTSVSLDPPLILFCLDLRATILSQFETAGFAINILSEEQQALSSRFARAGIDRFDGVEWAPGETGVPLLPGTLASMECALVHTHDAGDHRILLGEVLRVRVAEGAPLVYFGGYRKLENTAAAVHAGG